MILMVVSGTQDLSKMASVLSTVSAIISFAPKLSVNPNNPSTISHSLPPRFPKTTLSLQNPTKIPTHYVSPMAASASSSSSSSVGNAEYMEEPATSVKFPKSLNIPDCSSSMSLLGTGYREKVFAIIGVKVYAAGLYVNPSMLKDLQLSEGKSENLAVFQSMYQSSLEKSLEIVLVRDVDGKTFWDALDEAVSPRMTSPTPVDHSALETFRSIFQGRSLKKGTLIFLTWLQPSKMSVSVSSNGVPEKSDARIESMNVTKALFDVFFGESPVSPTLKVSVASGLASIL